MTGATPTGVDRDFAPLLERAFQHPPQEGSYAITEVEGKVPDFVRGSYYLTGPARFRRGEQRYRHWLDGDGMVCALHFDADGGIRFANRFVDGEKHREEEAAGRALYRTFGTSFPGDQLLRGVALASPVNVSVYRFAGTLLAFGEQGLPWELDPETLETRGLYTFGRRLSPLSPFSAHPGFDWETGDLFNFGISFAADQPRLNLYSFDETGERRYRKRLPLPYPCSVHDFGLGPRHSIFYLAPHLLDMGALAQEGKTIMEALSWEPERGSFLLVADRETAEQVALIPVGERYCLHQINAYEAGGRLVVDVVELDQPVYDQYIEVPDLFTEVRPGQPVRYELDMESWEVAGRQELDFPLTPDFPHIDPRRGAKSYNDFWILGISKAAQPGRKFFDRLAHLSWDGGGPAGVYEAPPHHYLGGEPVFVGKPGDEGSGVVICPELDAESMQSRFLVFDAFDVGRGPIARLPLRSPVHLGFHASFHLEG